MTARVRRIAAGYRRRPLIRTVGDKADVLVVADRRCRFAGHPGDVADRWEDFLYWLGADRKMARRIARLIAEIQCDPFTGIGKPEPLKGDLSGYWSRRIDDEHRLVYRADDKEVKILKTRCYYSD